MINISSEELISLAEAAARLPRRRQGKKPHIATLYRWTQRGCKGVVLETIQLGGTRCTSVEAMQRFFDRLSDANIRATSPLPTPVRPCSHTSSQLDKEGF